MTTLYFAVMKLYFAINIYMQRTFHYCINIIHVNKYQDISLKQNKTTITCIQSNEILKKKLKKNHKRTRTTEEKNEIREKIY